MKITHPSMSNFTQAEQPSQTEPKVYTVVPPDEDDILFDKQMATMEQEVVKDPKSDLELPEDPALKKEVEKKIAFEKLMFLSKDQIKDIEYGGLTFRFKVLKSNDNAKILELLQKTDLEEAYQASVMGLATSLVSVNNIPFEDFYSGTDSIKEPILRKYAELSKWPAFMVTALMAFSASVQREVEKEFSRSFLKS